MRRVVRVPLFVFSLSCYSDGRFLIVFALCHVICMFMRFPVTIVCMISTSLLCMYLPK
ncbi:uncharacterized protein ASPGLDRAFT_1111672 [Aspergillus glaucus CBS 516.65]|uniref:Uncharacterized protein n=1 Tax=Aspergillus glaucus CBS 516.65 TaxID=1160497 RepID=A0A1L9VST4_ASPGL|nr:hypothetical protein ASPGLDRAFT_1111672 [Aspergillus glaucus CBS 516.65]OJJ86962.1 hypothetical protein ASPGLDRAFT_1111672 [Aspergillus glaucus CBS 516.65]